MSLLTKDKVLADSRELGLIEPKRKLRVSALDSSVSTLGDPASGPAACSDRDHARNVRRPAPACVPGIGGALVVAGSASALPARVAQYGLRGFLVVLVLLLAASVVAMIRLSPEDARADPKRQDFAAPGPPVPHPRPQPAGSFSQERPLPLAAYSADEVRLAAYAARHDRAAAHRQAAPSRRPR